MRRLFAQLEVLYLLTFKLSSSQKTLRHGDIYSWTHLVSILPPRRYQTNGYRFVITFGYRCPPLRYTTAMLLNRLRLLDTCCVSIACEMQDTDYRSGSTIL